MIFTIETYFGAHKRIVKKRKKAWKQAKVSPMALDRYYILTHHHDRIIKRLEREVPHWEWL